MNVTYPGPHDAVTIPRCDVTVDRGESVEVDDDLGAQLVQQGWLGDGNEPAKDTVSGVLEWVDGDPAKAASALALEKSKGDKARTSLVDALNDLIPTSGVSNESEED